MGLRVASAQEAPLTAATLCLGVAGSCLLAAAATLHPGAAGGRLLTAAALCPGAGGGGQWHCGSCTVRQWLHLTGQNLPKRQPLACG